MQTLLSVFLGIHTAGNDDGDVLLGHDGVGENAGALSEKHKACRSLRQLLEAVDDDLELVGVLHNAANIMAMSVMADGGHHAEDTAAFKQTGHGVAGLGREGLLEHGEHFVAEVVAVHAEIKHGTHVALGLEDHAHDRAGNESRA